MTKPSASIYQGDLTELLVNGIVPVARELTHDGLAPASVL
jgi:hypothetical protein